MATAYAAITSLMHLTRDLHEHSYPPIKLDEEQFNSLNSNICFFQRFLEDHHTNVDLGMEIRIADAAYSVEDLMDSHIVDRVVDQDEFNGSLQKVIQDLDLIEKEVMKTNRTEEIIQGNNNQPRRHLASSSQPPFSANSGENIVVGIEDTTIKIVDKLTQPHASGRQIISITGMGGIGKTTLARKVYDNKCITDYFDICAWTTISKDYNTRQSLGEILRCLGRTESKESPSKKSEYDLAEQLYKYLIGRRYLIILDDVWDVEAWDKLRSFFPASRGSGIVITTRESTIASVSSHTFAMNFLDESQSWDLFCKNVFGRDSCPRELEGVGKKVANKCRGLPLSIVVIGGHLAKSPRTQEYWEYIADNLSAVVNSEDNNHCLKILSLSYLHLPVHLKPCFLYMGIFPEDEEIWVSKLIKLWVAEGFLKPISGKSLEEAAEDYLKDLIGRNLILVSRSFLGGKINSCKIHDLLMDFCLKEALDKKFLCIVRKQVPEVLNNERRIVVYPSAYKAEAIVLKSQSVLRTLIFSDRSLVVYKSSRVLASASGNLIISRNNVAEVTRHRQLVNLRCLEFSVFGPDQRAILPSSIFSIWNLQSLYIIDARGVTIPKEIWKMSQLRQIGIYEFTLSDSPNESDDILKNLRSLNRLLNFRCSEDLVKRIPNVMMLGLKYDDFNEVAYSLNNMARLEKLESLDFWLDDVSSIRTQHGVLSNITFPHSLKKLTIIGLGLDDVTTKIGSLPLLEVLYLWNCWGSEWEHVEGQFVRLKFLNVSQCHDLQCFTADVDHFPCLQELDLKFMGRLEEISSDIGDITTLRSIELTDCADSAVLCAKRIAEYQYNQMGNEQLRVMVSLAHKTGLSAESLSTSNFHVQH